MATSRGPGALPYVDPYDVDTLNPKEERTVEELWNAVPGGDKEIKSKAAVLKKYRKGFEGLFTGLSYCLKYGEKDDQVYCCNSARCCVLRWLHADVSISFR